MRERAYWRQKNARRRGAQVDGLMMTIEQLGVRDGWRCHLCRLRVRWNLVSPHPMSATFDHLIPISDGGTDAPENLALAHRFCNSSRGAGGVVQLALLG
jgi:5-methylcytosine-specific restriction endonuclease McrA